MIAEIIRFTSFLLPIFFMLLFFVKTDKLNVLEHVDILFLFVPVFLLIFNFDFGFKIELLTAYMILIFIGTHILLRAGWTYVRALSIAFCLAYFGSFLWELPTHIYTIALRGGIDGAFPLHIIYIFPILLIYEKLKTNLPRKDILKTLLCIFGYSSIVLIALVASGANIFDIQQNSLADQNVIQAAWMINRIAVVVWIFAIYANSTLRKSVQNDNEHT